MAHPPALPASGKGASRPLSSRVQGEASGLDPLHPCRKRWSLLPRQGAESSSLRSCGPHQPLDPTYACRRCSEKDPAEARSMSHTSGLLIYFAAGSVPPVFAHVLHDVLSVGWVPGCVTGRKVVQASSGDHLARLHVAPRGLSVKPFGNR